MLSLTQWMTIFVNAGIGMAAGSGAYAIAMVATLLTLVVLVLLPPVENYFEKRAGLPDRNRHTPS